MKVYNIRDYSSNDNLEKKLSEKPKKNQSLIKHLFKGEPYKFKLFNKEIKIIGKLYHIKKRMEFFDSYWPKFVKLIKDIDWNYEAYMYVVIDRYNNFSRLERLKVDWECSDIYAWNNKLTLNEFSDAVFKVANKK